MGMSIFILISGRELEEIVDLRISSVKSTL